MARPLSVACNTEDWAETSARSSETCMERVPILFTFDFEAITTGRGLFVLRELVCESASKEWPSGQEYSSRMAS